MKESNSLATAGRDAPAPLRPAPGFTAHLTGVSLIDLVRLQSLTESNGVFLVMSGEHSGILHFDHGQLFHAETRELRGDAAAHEILGWSEGEFIRSERAAASHATIIGTLEELLSSALAVQSAANPSRSMAATGVRRKAERGVEGSASSEAGVERPPSSARALRAAATPGIAAAPAPRRSSRLPEGRTIASALLSPLGELLEGQGPGADVLATRVAYVARLSEVIGQAMGSGETLALRVRYADSELAIQPHADGHIFGCMISPDAH